MTVNLHPDAFKKAESTIDGSVSLSSAKQAQAVPRGPIESALRLTLDSYREFPDGVTRYQVRVQANGNEWIVQRRFSDFEVLEKQIAPAGIRRAPLPAKGVLGLQSKLNLGDFKDKRMRGLQDYLNSLVDSLTSLTEMPALEAFCDPSVQSVAPAAGGGNVKAVAGAAAVGAVAGLMAPIVGGVVVAAAGAGAAAYATQRSDNVGEVSRQVGSASAHAIGKGWGVVKRFANEKMASNE